jgi:predicted dinucleotide-binding enzyme
MMIAVLGTGDVGKALAAGLTASKHEVRVGSRSEGEGRFTYAAAAAWAEVVVNATKGSASLEALRAAGAANLAGKVLIDVANPLDFSKGMPPTLFVKDDDSLAERIQREFPKARVVKTLNTMNSALMANPGLLREAHDVFMSGDDKAAKELVASLLRAWGWKHIRDLGDITTARGTEMLMPLWIRLWGAIGHANYNFHVAM